MGFASKSAHLTLGLRRDFPASGEVFNQPLWPGPLGRMVICAANCTRSAELDQPAVSSFPVLPTYIEAHGG